MVSQYLKGYSSFELPELIKYSGANLSETIEQQAGGNIQFDRIVGRNILELNSGSTDISALKSILSVSGEIHLTELLPFEGSKLSDFCPDEFQSTVCKAEDILLTNSACKYEKIEQINSIAKENDFEVTIRKEKVLLTNSFSRKSMEHWFRKESDRSSLGDVVEGIAGEEIRDRLNIYLSQKFLKEKIEWYQMVAFIRLKHK